MSRVIPCDGRPIVGECVECGCDMHSLRARNNGTCENRHRGHGGRGLCTLCYQRADAEGSLHRYAKRGQRRGVKPDTAAPTLRTCPTCQRSVVFRVDGTPSRHWASERKGLRTRCPAGEHGRPPATLGRRVTVQVTVDVVLPSDTSTRAFKAELRRLIREHSEAKLVVAVDVREVS
jgi:hypothetical protein